MHVHGTTSSTGGITRLGSFESIASFGSASFIDFNSIPSTYTHLQLRFLVRDSALFTERAVFIEINDNLITGSNSIHAFLGNGSTGSGTNAINQGRFGSLVPIPGSSNTANVFSCGIVDFIDYANVSKNKVVKIMHGYDANGSGKVGIESYLFNSTNAISKIRFYTNVSMVAGSSVSLYGVK
jgi:hypothetical protein